MPPSRPDLVHRAICAGTMGQIEWKQSAEERVRKDPRMKRFTPHGIRLYLHEWVLDHRGTIETREETDADWRAEYPDDPWWYFSIILLKEVVEELPDGVFVKMKLLDPEDDTDPWVQIISCHEQIDMTGSR